MSSTIQNHLNNIKKAVYGADVRQAIHDSIQECYSDVSIAKTKADNAVENANAAATNAQNQANTANTAASTANQAASNANAAASKAYSSKEACDTTVAAIPGQLDAAMANLGLTIQNGKLCVKVERTT